MLGPMEKKKNKKKKQILRTSQPNEGMSSAVSLPNHTITGQTSSSKQLVLRTFFCHMLGVLIRSAWFSSRNKNSIYIS